MSRSARRLVRLVPRVLLAPLLALLAGALGGCASHVSGATGGGPLRVVAAENFWGSVAAQLAGTRATVRSVIVDPDTDPHSYEPTAADAITLAGAQLAIVNGIGYDGWASRLLAADASPRLRVLDVGRLLGLHEGDNPHQWYSPTSVRRVARQIALELTSLDARDAAYFDRRLTRFDDQGLARYHALIAAIRSRYAGTPIGYSESIFAPLGRALGLRLLTPASFARAIAEGADVTAADKAAVDAQAQRHQIAVWVYNSQNATPDVARVTALARAAHIPVTTITETLAPASDSFQQWQVSQLQALANALHRATGR